MLPDDVKCTVCGNQPKLKRADDTDYIITCCGFATKSPSMPMAVRKWRMIYGGKRLKGKQLIMKYLRHKHKCDAHSFIELSNDWHDYFVRYRDSEGYEQKQWIEPIELFYWVMSTCSVVFKYEQPVEFEMRGEIDD